MVKEEVIEDEADVDPMVATAIAEDRAVADEAMKIQTAKHFDFRV